MKVYNASTLTIIACLVLLLLFVAIAVFYYSSRYFQSDNIAITDSLSYLSEQSNKVNSISASTHLREQELTIEELKNTSLDDTAVDRVTLDVHDDKIVLNGGLLFYFDYFLNLQGERSLPVIKQLLLRDLAAHYPDKVAVQIYDIFERYLLYLTAVSQRLDNVTNNELLQHGVAVREWENDIKLEHFSTEEVEQLFGSYQKMLSTPTKAADNQKRLESYQQAIMKNPEHLDAIATEIFGTEAAQRLRKLEQEREHWQQRFAYYKNLRENIDRSESLDENGKTEAIKLLKERLFSESEQRRVQSLEKSHSS